MPQAPQPRPPPPQRLAECGRPASRRAGKRRGRMPRRQASTAKCPAPGATAAAHPQGWPGRAAAASGTAAGQPAAAGLRRSKACLTAAAARATPQQARAAGPAAAAADATASPAGAAASASSSARSLNRAARCGLSRPEPIAARARAQAQAPPAGALEMGSWRSLVAAVVASACGSRSAMRPAPRGCNLRAAARPIRRPAEPQGRPAA